MISLWDLLGRHREPEKLSAEPAPAPLEPARSANSMRARYDSLVRDMLSEHGVRVRKWRSNMSGVAWQVMYADGSVSKLIEAPRPRGPMSAAVFLHEIGHHAIGFHRYSPRCLEEHMAWAWAIEQMQVRELNITDGVRRRVWQSMRYAIGKARRRGIKQVPAELSIYLTPAERVALGIECVEPAQDARRVVAA
ncbi:MAG: hypothetical protein KF684_02290 [Phycisphaeraceae bacterium]|nr:hypothetical protein [Phycisphaeraceae bacterium]